MAAVYTESQDYTFADFLDLLEEEAVEEKKASPREKKLRTKAPKKPKLEPVRKRRRIVPTNVNSTTDTIPGLETVNETNAMVTPASTSTSELPLVLPQDTLTKGDMQEDSKGHGRLYVCDEKMKSSETYKHLIGDSEVFSRLFYPIGKGVYIDRMATSGPRNQDSAKTHGLRMSLWKPNAIQKLTMANGRFSVPLNMDALKRLHSNLSHIRDALARSDQETFLGYCLHLGKRWYVSVERGDCSIHFRQWFQLKADCMKQHQASPSDSDIELLPTRKGLKLDWDQFSKLMTFMSQDLATVVPGYGTHVFTCYKPEHVESICHLCTPTGCLPMERQARRIMADAARGLMTEKTVLPLSRAQVYELSLRMKSSWYRLTWIMNIPENMREKMIRVGMESGEVYPAMVTLLGWMLRYQKAPRVAHLMWLLDESGVEFEQEMYFTDNKFKLFSTTAYDWLQSIGGFYRD